MIDLEYARQHAIRRVIRDAVRWIQAGLPELTEHQVAIDGKNLRGSRGDDDTVHIISTFATLGACRT